MTEFAIPHSSPSRRWLFWAILPAAFLIALLAYWLTTHGGGAPIAGGTDYQPVRQVDLVQRVLKDGELQAVNNIDIICDVEGRNTILTMVKEGSYVHKGDVLITIDSASIRQKIEDTTLDLQKADNDVIASKEIRDIQESQNSANLEAAQIALELAKLDLQQYVEGTYPQSLATAKTTKEMAEITLKNRQDDLNQTRSLASKGFVTAADVKKAELEVTTANNALEQANTSLLVMEKYAHQMDLASKKSAVAQAEQKLLRTQKENASNLAQKVADLQAKTSALRLLNQRMDRLKEQLTSCTISAPAEGLVVYSSSGDRFAPAPLQEGATVTERQRLMRLPDTSAMKAVLSVNEAQVARLREGMRATVTMRGTGKMVGATLSRISVLSDSSQRWWNPDLKEYPVELTLDETPAGLKPSMGVDAEIIVDRATGVPAIPLTSLYSTGDKSFAFLRDNPPRPVEVKVGRTNETLAEIVDGLAVNDEVLLLQSGQGRALLEQAGIKVGEAPPHTPNKPDAPAKRDAAVRPEPAVHPDAGSDNPAKPATEKPHKRRPKDISNPEASPGK